MSEQTRETPRCNWATDQSSPWRCILDAGHEGAHRQRHIAAREATAPAVPSLGGCGHVTERDGKRWTCLQDVGHQGEHDGPDYTCAASPSADEPCSEDCMLCTGESCAYHGAAECDCDVIDRHADAEDRKRHARVSKQEAPAAPSADEQAVIELCVRVIHAADAVDRCTLYGPADQAREHMRDVKTRALALLRARGGSK
jgi:hypothetical protein